MNKNDYIIFFDVINGNPNGDPDNDNTPRVNDNTGKGIVTAECLKRKIRNMVELLKNGAPGYETHVKMGTNLDAPIIEIADSYKDSPNKLSDVFKKLCETFWDIRSFGSVVAVKGLSQHITGPLQVTDAQSIDPIDINRRTITRMAVNDEAAKKGDDRTIGRRYEIPYALYKSCMFVNPFMAEKTGFSEEDLETILTAIKNMFEFDRSSGRGIMGIRKIIQFEHNSQLGSAPYYELEKLVTVNRKVENPASYDDYEITIDYDKCPAGVTIKEL